MMSGNNAQQQRTATDSTRQMKAGAVISYLAILFNILTGLVYIPWMTAKLGQSDYGLFTLALSIIGYFVMDFGLSGCITKFISKYRAENQEQQINRFLGIIYRLYLMIDVILLVIFCVVLLFLQNIFIQLTPLELDKLTVVLWITGLFSIFSLPFVTLNGILISYEYFVALKISDFLNRLLTVVLMVAVLLLGYRLYALVIVNTVVNLGITLFKLFFINRHTTISVDFSYRDKKLLKQIFDFSIWIAVIGISQRLILNITPSVLGMVSGTVQISIFSIGMAIEAYIWAFSNAFSGFFLPKVTRMAVDKVAREEITDLMIKVGRIQFLVVGLMIAGFASMGQEFMLLWMGEKYADSYWVAVFLIVPGIFLFTQEIAYNLLMATDRIRLSGFMYMLSACISLVISVLLSKEYGAIGSAIGIFTGNVIGQVLGMNIIYHKVLSIDILRFFGQCHLKMLVPFLMTLMLGLLVQHLVAAPNLLFFLIKAVFLAACYGLSMWLLALNVYEKKLFKGLVLRFRQ